VGLLLLCASSGSFLRLFPGSLLRCPGFEFSGNRHEVIRHFRVRLQEEELQVASLVFELYLGSIFEDVRYCSIGAKQLQNLAPVWSLHHIQARHKSLLLFLGPRSARRVDTLSPGMSRVLRKGGLSSLVVEHSAGTRLIWRKISKVALRECIGNRLGILVRLLLVLNVAILLKIGVGTPGFATCEV
jgi:hypothetical protein